jgi:hypothetical protein
MRRPRGRIRKNGDRDALCGSPILAMKASIPPPFMA